MHFKTSENNTLTNGLRHSYSQSVFCDISLSFTNQNSKFYAHKSVLASVSPFLRRLLESCPDSETLLLSGFEMEETAAVLNLIYTGEMTVSQKQITGTSQIIEQLQIRLGNSKFGNKKSFRPLLVKDDSSLLFFLSNPKVIKSKSKKPKKISSIQRTSKSRDKKFSCEICGRQFALPCHLRRHSLIHLDKKPFSCSFCSRNFTSKFSVKQHEFSRHLKERYGDGLSKTISENNSKGKEKEKELQSRVISDKNITNPFNNPKDLKSVDTRIQTTIIEVLTSESDSGTFLQNIPDNLLYNIEIRSSENQTSFWSIKE